MKYINYLLWVVGVASLVAIMVGWSVVSGLLLIPVFIIPLAVIVVYAARRLVTPIIDDELNKRIRGDAAMRTVEVLFITGAIIMSILFSLTISTALSPKVTGHIITNDDKTRSMAVTIHYNNPLDTSHSSLRSFIIRNMEAMDYQEAGSYATFWQEGLRSYYENDLIARIIGSLLIFILSVYGIFYVYYRRKY